VSVPPVRRLDRRLAVENARWHVYLDHIRDASGREVPDYLVVEPKVRLSGGVTGVAVLPVIDERVVLLPTWRHAIGAQGHEVVKGFIDAGEEPAGAAMRELGEETGLACRPENLRFAGYVAPEPSTLAGKGALFLALDCVAVGQQAEDEIGLGRPALFDADAIETMIRTGEIEDAMTLVACLRWLRLNRR
jgi:8-oxo-dGTP pyrophosphatase MutT (NUDIX family)